MNFVLARDLTLISGCNTQFKEMAQVHATVKEGSFPDKHTGLKYQPIAVRGWFDS